MESDLSVTETPRPLPTSRKSSLYASDRPTIRPSVRRTTIAQTHGSAIDIRYTTRISWTYYRREYTSSPSADRSAGYPGRPECRCKSLSDRVWSYPERGRAEPVVGFGRESENVSYFDDDRGTSSVVFPYLFPISMSRSLEMVDSRSGRPTVIHPPDPVSDVDDRLGFVLDLGPPPSSFLGRCFSLSCPSCAYRLGPDRLYVPPSPHHGPSSGLRP